MYVTSVWFPVDILTSIPTAWITLVVSCLYPAVHSIVANSRVSDWVMHLKLLRRADSIDAEQPLGGASLSRVLMVRVPFRTIRFYLIVFLAATSQFP